jgi:hypothetical protein
MKALKKENSPNEMDEFINFLNKAFLSKWD